MNNRQSQIKKNLSGRNGGTTAPAGAAGGYSTGINQQSAAYRPQTGLRNAKPAAAPQAAGAPGAGGPAPTPMPWDVAASNDEAGALKRKNNAIAGLDAGYLRTQQDFGLEGPWADYKTNPYSQAALLQRQYDQAQSGTMNSYAARGHLYSGALVRGREGNTFQFGESRDSLQKQYAGEGAKYQAGKLAAEDDYNETVNEANWNRVNAGIESEPDSSAAPAGQGKAKAKNKKNAKGKQQQNNNKNQQKGRNRR